MQAQRRCMPSMILYFADFPSPGSRSTIVKGWMGNSPFSTSEIFMRFTTAPRTALILLPGTQWKIETHPPSGCSGFSKTFIAVAALVHFRFFASSFRFRFFGGIFWQLGNETFAGRRRLRSLLWRATTMRPKFWEGFFGSKWTLRLPGSLLFWTPSALG